MPVPVPTVQPQRVTSQSRAQSPQNLLNRTALEARTLHQVAGTPSFMHACITMAARPFAAQQRQLRPEEPPKVNECAATDCNRRIRLAHTRRMLLPHAQHRNDDVQRTYRLQHRRMHHHHAKPSTPNRIKSNPARKAATQASACVCQP